MANRDLLKEAIADAKAVKETAIANAKAALEEAFTPYLKEKLAAKLAEMDEMDEAEDKMAEGMDAEKEVKEVEEMDEAKEMDEANDAKGYEGQMGKKDLGVKEGEDMDEAEDMDEMDLDELLAELDAELNESKDKEEGKEMDEALDTINDPNTPTAKGNMAEVEEEESEEVEVDAEETEDEEIDLEDMSEEDLKKFIEDVIADMVEAGELEAGEGMEGEEEGEEGEEGEMDIEMDMDAEETEIAEEKEEMEEGKDEMDEMKKEIEELKRDLQEVNLLNSKLLYVNKIFRSKNLTENQKAKVLGAFDRATTVAEVKLVFETISEGLTPSKAAIKENLGSASKPMGVSPKKPILEVNDQFARWQKLAGIK